MCKPRDTKVAILPSTTRKGTTLSTSAALDSPSVISQLVSPPQTSRVGISAESENFSDNFDDASTVLDSAGSLGHFLDATIARSRQIEITETPNENTVTPVNSPEIDDLDEDYVELDDDFIDKCNATTSTSNLKKLIAQHAEKNEAEELLAKISKNHDDWSTPEPTPTPILKKRGMIELNDEDMREAKKSLMEKGIKSEDVKNLPPIEDLCKIIPPSSTIEVHSLQRFDRGDIPYSKPPDQCLDEFDNYIVKQSNFNMRVENHLMENSQAIGKLHDIVERTSNDVKMLVKHFDMIQTQIDQLTKVQNDLLKNNHEEKQVYEVTTRGGVSTQDPLYPEGHPKRIEQDSQRTKEISSPSKKKKKKHKTVVESSEPVNDPNSISISDAETESGNEHEEDNDKNDIPDKEEIEKEPEKHDKNKKYTKEDFITKKHGAVIDCNKGKVTFNVDDKEHTVYFPKRIDKDFEFHRSQTNPMVRYKIYNKTINLPFSDFCAAIRVPQWGSCEKVRGTPRELSNLYTMICNGRSFSDDGGKISSIQQPAIRYFAYFVTKCVLARRKGWSITENELNAYIEREGHRAREGTEEAEEHLDSSSDAASSSYQHYGHVEPPRHSSAQGPYYHSMYDPPAWNPDPRWE
ncbi:hypothetical protein QYE76_043700 [Lolium multiflorum]|uniref:Arabidopsis retrotransposon Orf1 C-terminal domain-containing protein n=1 Tax=Lolium multiflorum TaxID=4521 RepID=A0AAD8TJI0_LOLMU|nr:hypothetical protein QYE76_043700 [Lolium multiflorum]